MPGRCIVPRIAFNDESVDFLDHLSNTSFAHHVCRIVFRDLYIKTTVTVMRKVAFSSQDSDTTDIYKEIGVRLLTAKELHMVDTSLEPDDELLIRLGKILNRFQRVNAIGTVHLRAHAKVYNVHKAGLLQ
jgi:hypothetical protein